MDTNRNLAVRPRERREAHRKATNIVVHIAAPQGLFFGYARNVSPGGICVESEVPLPVGTTAQLTFRLFTDREEPLRLRGRVAWVAPSNTPVIHRLGFTFDAVTEAAAQEIESYL